MGTADGRPEGCDVGGLLGRCVGMRDGCELGWVDGCIPHPSAYTHTERDEDAPVRHRWV